MLIVNDARSVGVVTIAIVTFRSVLRESKQNEWKIKIPRKKTECYFILRGTVTRMIHA